MNLRPLAFLVASVCAGCAPLPEAPTDIAELSLYLFQNFDEEGPTIDAGLQNLGVFLESGVDLDAGLADRRFSPPLLEGDSLGTLALPDGQTAESQVPVAVAYLSRHSVAQHESLVSLEDQTPFEPSAPNVYERSFLTDRDCFVAGSCERLDTLNRIRKERATLRIEYDMYKDFRRVSLPDGRPASIARAWVDQVWIGDEGANSIDQTFTIEVWIESAERPEEALRFISLWSASTLNPPVSDEFAAGVVAFGIEEIFRAHDTYLDD